jgi:predicted RNA methylase
MEVLQKECIVDSKKKLESSKRFWCKLRMKFRDFWDFICMMLRSKAYHFKDFLYALVKYYPKNYLFAKIDLSLLSDYWLESPFVISRHYLQLKLEPDIYQYGETPLLTIERIAQKLTINENDHVFELGSGAGRCAFWIACFCGCRVTGIEQIPQFIDCTQRLLDRHKPLKQKINFIRGNFLREDLSMATIVYLYGSKMSNREIESLVLNFNALKPETRIVTVSYSLNEIIGESKNKDVLEKSFPVIASFEAEFFWGKATVFVQKKL